MDHRTEERRKQRHSLTLLEQVKRMKESSEIVDVVLVAEGQKFPCHKVVLAAFSSYFKAMFTCGLVECTQREVVLYDISAESVSVILNYIYSADLHLTNQNVQTVALASYFMQMEDVFSLCQKYMMDHMDASNCVGIYYFANHIGAEDLCDQAKRYLYQHFAEVSLQEEILEIEVQQLLALIKSDDLNVSREESILDLVIRWVNHSRKSRAEHLIKLLKEVRLMDLPDDEPDRLSNRMFQYDPGRDKWTERAPMKYSKYRFSTAVVNSEIYVLGGIGCLGRDRGQTRKCLDAVEIYNPDGDFWRDGPPMPSPLLSLRTNSTCAGCVEGKLYLCGGFHGAARHEVITKEILELDTWENQWNVVAINVLMHDSYDVCLVARLNPRDLIPPPPDLVDQ
uniref:Kelch repeat and BTB domain containing 12 n=1 Tax=Gallus gallus TaxID=9031 RepID=A0A8V1AG76_CHICK